MHGGFEGNNEIISRIEAHFDETIHFWVTVHAEKVSGQIFNIGRIKEKASEYLIICFPKETNEIRQMFLDFKYTIEDVIYVNPTLDYSKNSVDQYGNAVSTLPPNVKLLIKGCNNIVKVRKIKCESKIDIIINGDGAEITINEGVEFRKDYVITITSSENSKARLMIDENTVFWGDGMISIYYGEIIIGKKCTFNRMCKMFAHYHYSIVIEDDCMCSHEVIFLSGDCHNIYDVVSKKCINSGKLLNQGKNQIRIKEHVWIGIRSTILNGTEVGQGTIIGACSVVKGKYPNNCAIAGNVAKIVRKNVTWDRYKIEADGLIDILNSKYISETII